MAFVVQEDMSGYTDTRPGTYMDQAIEDLILNLGLEPAFTRTITINVDDIVIETYAKDDNGRKYIQDDGFVAMNRTRHTHAAFHKPF